MYKISKCETNHVLIAIRTHANNQEFSLSLKSGKPLGHTVRDEQGFSQFVMSIYAQALNAMELLQIANFLKNINSSKLIQSNEFNPIKLNNNGFKTAEEYFDEIPYLDHNGEHIIKAMKLYANSKLDQAICIAVPTAIKEDYTDDDLIWRERWIPNPDLQIILNLKDDV